MRRISAYLCAAAFALLSVLPADAANDYAFETMLTPSTDDASVGDIVTVECNVYGITDVNGLIAIDTTVEYDPAILEYQDTEVLFPELWTGDNEDLTRAEVGADGKGRVFLSFANDGRPGKGVTEGTITAKLRFRVKSGGRGRRRSCAFTAATARSRSTIWEKNGSVWKGLRRRSCPSPRTSRSKSSSAAASVAVILVTALPCTRKQEKAKAPARKEMR